MLIVNGVIHTMDGAPIQHGFVRTDSGRIAQVGQMDSLPPLRKGETSIDANQGHVLPGFLDIHCHLGLFGSGAGERGDDLNEDSIPCTPHLRALDGVNPMDPSFADARKNGVVCVMTGPGSVSPISGQTVLMKTIGRVADHMVLRAPAAMKFALGENPKIHHGKQGRSPSTRMGTAAMIREMLAKALDYELKFVSSQTNPQCPDPESNIQLDALRPVVTGKLPAHFHAHRADDIVTAVRISKEFGLDCVIVHGTEAHLIADYLAQEHIPVITGPVITDRFKPEMANLSLENTAILAKAGVQVAICTDYPETPIGLLPLCASLSARAGMDEDEALAAITLNAARIAGVDDRLGSLTCGKDADLVVMDGHPLDWRTKVTHVLIDGQEV